MEEDTDNRFGRGKGRTNVGVGLSGDAKVLEQFGVGHHGARKCQKCGPIHPLPMSDHFEGEEGRFEVPLM